MTTIATNLQEVLSRISNAARASARSPEEITLLAVSKTWPAHAIRELAATGHRAFGENFVQEGVEKCKALSDLALEWHFIGPLQSNKTRLVAEHFAWVHAIDRLNIAERLALQRPAHLPPLQVCIQVNISGETTKHGLTLDAVSPLAHALIKIPRLQLRGLMCIPAPIDNPHAQREAFRPLKTLFTTLQAEGLPLDTLSMGMSHDLESAIAEGATLVRVGTAIFGERHSA